VSRIARTLLFSWLTLTVYLVRDGVNKQEMNNGIKEWRKRHGHE